MLCPKCKAEVSSDDEFCIMCGASLNGDSNENVNQEEKKENLLTLVGIIILTILIIVATIIGIRNSKLNAKGKYKSLVPIENSILEKKSSTELLILANQQDKDLSERISKVKPNKASELFETLYDNLIKYKNKMSIDALDIKVLSDDYIINPHTDLFTFQTSAWKAIWINNKYLNEKYSKFLTPELQEYLKIVSSNIVDDFNKNEQTQIVDIAKEIISLQNFLKKNPFVMRDSILDIIHSEISFLLLNEYSFNENGSMTKENIEGYEEILKNADSSSDEYKIISDCYNKLQKNNFMPSVEFIRTVEEYSHSEWHKKLYEDAKKASESIEQINPEDLQQTDLPQTEEQVQETQNQPEPEEQTPQENQNGLVNFDNFNISRDEISTTYRESGDFCSQHLADVDENNNPLYTDDGSYDGCIKKMFEQKSSDYYNVFNEVWNQCASTRGASEGDSGTKQCVIDEFEKIR